MQTVSVRARTTMVGDYGKKYEGDVFNLPDNLARWFHGRGMVEYTAPVVPSVVCPLRYTVKLGPSTKVAPLVSCIMPTKDRPQFIPGAIDCFLRQTYPHKELVILDDGESIEHMIPRNPAIRYLRIPGPLCIGTKRNMCCEQSNGDLIAHWDDDDWSTPTRLEEQVRALTDNPKIKVTGYNTMLFLDERNGKAYRYTGRKNYALGTSLMYSREFWLTRKFNGIQIGEDSMFIKDAPLLTLPAEKRMVARIHKQTTSAKLGGEEYKLVPISELPDMALEKA